MRDVIHLEQQELEADQFDVMMSSSRVKETGFAGKHLPFAVLLFILLSGTGLHSASASSSNHTEDAVVENGDEQTESWSCTKCTE